MRLRRPHRRVADPARRAGIVVLAAGVLVGCGSSHATAKLPVSMASAMNTHLKNVSTAAGRHDRAGATRELDAFAVDVAQQKAAGHLPASDYVALETGIRRARARIGIEVVALAPAVTTPAAPAPTVAPAPPSQTISQGLPLQVKQPKAGKAKDGGPGKGGGKGHGHGGD